MVQATPPAESPDRFPVSLTLVFLLCLALAGAATVALLIAGAGVARSAQAVQHTLQVQRAIERLQSTLLDAETGQRGYLLTGQEHFLAPYIDAIARHAYYLGMLESLVRENPRQRQALDELKPMVEERLRQLSVTLNSYRRSSDAAERALVDLNHGKQIMDHVRVGLDGMRLEEERELARRQDEAAQRARYGVVLLFVASIVSVFGLAVLYGAMRRYHARREEMRGALDRSEGAFHELFESGALGIAQGDAQSSRFLRANERLAELTGYTGDELRRTTLIDLLPRDARLDNARAYREVVAGTRRVLELEQTATRKDGSTFYAWVRVTATGSGENTPTAIFVDDASHRRAVADILQKSHALLEAVSESTRDFVYAKDIDGRVLLANQALLDALGKPREDVVGQLDDGIIGDSEQASRARANDLKVIADRRAQTVEETLTLGGTARTYLGTKAPIFDASGNVIGVVAIGTDITARKAAEGELRESHDRLAELVERRNLQLSELSQWLLRVTEEERAKLAMELHDELGASLSAIWLDVIAVLSGLRGSAPELAARQERALEALVATSDHIRALVEGLRPMLLDQIGLAAALDALAARWSESARIPVRTAIASPMPPLDPAAELALFRIVQEALTNVARHAQAKEVEITLAGDHEAVRVSISDDGVGIDPAVLDRTGAHGILGMRERVRAWEGTLAVRRGAGEHGTVVIAAIPRAGHSAPRAS